MSISYVLRGGCVFDKAIFTCVQNPNPNLSQDLDLEMDLDLDLGPRSGKNPNLKV